MKKITGKVVSLVLALALVVTSFSANFAFASTKTISGTISDTLNDDLYLVNKDGDNAEFNLANWLIDSTHPTLETKEHGAASDPTISAISHVSGDKLVSADIDEDAGTASLKLKNKSGTEVISVLYSGSYTDPDDDDDTEYTVKGRANLTIHVYDEGDIVFGEVPATLPTDGSGLDDFETFAMNKNATKQIGIYKAVQGANSAATFEEVQLVTAKEGVTFNTGATTDNVYYYEMTSGDSDVHVGTLQSTTADGTADSVLTAQVGRGTLAGGLYPDDAKTGTVTINVKKMVLDDDGTYKASKESDDKYTLKTKVDKKVAVGAIAGYDKAVNYSIKKGSGSTTVLSGTGLTDTNVKDCEVVFPSSSDTDYYKTNAYTGDVSVGEKTSVTKISGELGTLKISDGKVGTVAVDVGNVDVTGGKVGDITTKDGNVDINGDDAVVGNINTKDDTAAVVTVDAGTVGDIKTKGHVDVTSNDEDVDVAVGTITAPYATITSDDAKLAIKGLVISDDNGKTTIVGQSKLTIGSIDADYYDTEFAFGDSDEFVGTVPAPKNAKNATISTDNEDTVLTVTGALTADTIDVGSDTNVTFTDAVTVKNVDGDGTMKIAAGKLYVSDSASSVTLKLSDTTLAPGTTVFKADKDAVDVDDFDTFGYTLDVSSGTDVDTFKIKTISFAGIAINKTSSSIAKGYSETFTASAYPFGTSLPTGATIKWELDGGSSDVFTLTTSGNTAKVDVVSVDKDFASENKTTLTATLYDADGDEMDDYDAATCDVTALAVPDATSDTTKDFSVAKGSSYQFKITSATAPTFTVGTPGVFTVALASKNGNDYFYKITATGNVGAATGVYLNGTKLLVATVKAPAFTTDTTKDMTVKGSYTLKVTATATPTFALGTAGVFKAEFVSKTGNDYLYKITSVGAAGAKTGVYVNGVKTFVATVG
ncbi:Ig-like domain-containing protein [Caproiciproducens faecalis]|uniref:Uncharacterized protein n=1 Tax=Caproiciproducens faecalis TaxID=2820301 RepID=A0ABS7DLY6_9FIRM|nr:hypothetical protein [Caproiciproducens faecalis]MBW7571561.1 hypothetical protein [Caproiciproducens faecalis]